jgi:hypothetical protein
LEGLERWRYSMPQYNNVFFNLKLKGGFETQD